MACLTGVWLDRAAFGMRNQTQPEGGVGMKKSILLLFPAPPQGAPANVALLGVRLVAGYAFVLHGWPKIKNPFGWLGSSTSIPDLLEGLAAVAEFFGGIAWML